MWTRGRIGGVLAAMVLLGAACSGSDDDQSVGIGRTTTTSDAGRGGGDGGEQGGGGLTISAEDIAFSTDTLTASSGEFTVTFENNDDGIQHNFHVTVDGEDFKTEIEQGPTTQELELAIDEPGEYAFVCDVHPAQMTGTLVVE